MSNGTIELRRPRVRGLEERFESRILPLFKRRTQEVGTCFPSCTCTAWPNATSMSPSEACSATRRRCRRLDRPAQGGLASGVRRLEQPAGQRPRSGLLVGRWHLRQGWPGEGKGGAVDRDRRAARRSQGGLGGRERSAGKHGGLVRDLARFKARGMEAPKLVIGDGNLGIWGALANVFPEAKEQRCWNHRIMNILDQVPKKQQAQARQLVTKIPYAETREQAEKLKRDFQAWCRKRTSRCGAPRRRLGPNDDLLRLPQGALATPANDERGRVPLRGGPPAHHGGQALQEGRERHGRDLENADGRREELPKIDAPELLAEVADGANYVNGVRSERHRARVPA